MTCDHHTLADFVFVHWGWSLVVITILGTSAFDSLDKIAAAISAFGTRREVRS